MASEALTTFQSQYNAWRNSTDDIFDFAVTLAKLADELGAANSKQQFGLDFVQGLGDFLSALDITVSTADAITVISNSNDPGEIAAQIYGIFLDACFFTLHATSDGSGLGKLFIDFSITLVETWFEQNHIKEIAMEEIRYLVNNAIGFDPESLTLQKSGNDVQIVQSWHNSSLAVTTGDNDDVITSTSGQNLNDNFNLGGGNDTVTVTGGFDSVTGGEGSDLLIADYGDASQRVYMDNLQPDPNGYQGVLRNVGQSRETYFSGIERFDIRSGSGSDIINTGNGDDKISTGAGDDEVNSGDGNDIVDGGAGIDSVFQDWSTRTTSINWNLQTDAFSGPGSWTNFERFGQLRTGSGDDNIVTGNTFVLGNVIDLGGGNDTVRTGAGFVNVNGGEGSDLLIADYGDASQRVYMDNLQPDPNGYQGVLRNVGQSRETYFSGIERFDIRSGSGSDIINTGNGDDKISTGAGDDEVNSGDGNDTLDGGEGTDQLTGGADNDTYLTDQQSDLIFESPNEGTDSVTSTASYYLYANVENLTLAASSGNLFGVGNELANSLIGNEGQNLLIAGLGDDIVHGGVGVDSLFGEGGLDQLYGDAGIDYLVGGAGNDVLDGGEDADAIYGEDGDDVLISGASFDTDILVGGSGNDTLRADSGQANPDYDLIDGGSGNDAYWVDTGADLTYEALDGGTDTVHANVPVAGAGVYLWANVEHLVLEGTTSFGVGNELANQLTGNASANYLLGGGGNDILNGKQGGDVLFGEAGMDIFVFETGTGGDVIGDFAKGVDRIKLTGVYSGFIEVQEHYIQNGADGAIDLGNGDLIVLHNTTMTELKAADFIFG